MCWLRTCPPSIGPILKHLRPKPKSLAPPSQASWADQQDCQNALVEDHSGGFRIETHRPGGVVVGLRLGEVSPVEVRPGEDRPGEIRLEEVRPAEVRPKEVRLAEVRFGEVRPDEVRPREVRPWFDRVVPDLHKNHATSQPGGATGLSVQFRVGIDR